MRYTSFYKRIGAGNWGFDADNPLWKSLLQRMQNGQKPSVAAFELHQASALKITDITKRFGCMGFDCRGSSVVLHFRNDFSSASGPLSRQQITERLAELKDMFGYILKHHPDVRFVEGCSWLYSYRAYCRLFPEEYIAGTELVKEIPVRLHSAWGQFVNSEGDIHCERADCFKEKVGAAASLQELLDSFPFRVFRSKSDIRFFYLFYKIL
jgi:hypothetical protein